MTELPNTVQNKVVTQRIIGHLTGAEPGPTTVFVGGLHGNEPAGVIALQQLMQELKQENITIKGNIYAVAGNLWALRHGQRFQQEDLNRLWTLPTIKKLIAGNYDPSENEDRKEQCELYDTFSEIVKNETGPFYFFDLHTTSSRTIPFITVNDNLLNRRFTSQYPVPIILGIEEYLVGPLLSYVNELGYVAFGFEGGQHDDPQAVINHKAFSYLSLAFSGCIPQTAVQVKRSETILRDQSKEKRGFFEIFHHYPLQKTDTFIMEPGFTNFQSIGKGQLLAHKNGKPIIARYKGEIFMPLYQQQGRDGFFVVRSIPKVFMHLSRWLRKLHVDALLPVLPGVRWQSRKKDTIIVDIRIARFFTKDFFHLLGYRSREIDRFHILMKNREKAAKTAAYKDTEWYSRN
ncbi:succinylglutamate desuccinylase/aspartoacylase family protein [Altibacter sp.]|uniref:succinylglutamate desuccinylase/aspartoacylase family protein n=1 Tax=Altibacter sp. TaxID=2024823 RepID=UPI002589249B|nr:succinylglutamate desuccinylase/aspartoacylase family protein [Altibacter sp.]MCW9038551.1 succinylglutamate desuccinylase/aspartoacylase family protein [Altibacter sp.]